MPGILLPLVLMLACLVSNESADLNVALVFSSLVISLSCKLVNLEGDVIQIDELNYT